MSKNGIESLREMLLSGNIHLKHTVFIDKDLTQKYWNLMKFTKDDEKEIIKKAPSNLDYVRCYGDLSADDLKDAVFSIEEILLTNEDINYLYENSIIETEDVIDLYMKKKINLVTLSDIDEEHKINYKIFTDELMQYYKNMKGDENLSDDFQRYALMYRELKLKNKDENEKKQLEEQIVEKIYEINDDNYDKDFKNLYNYGLLTIDTLVDWNGEEIIYDMIKEKLLKPKDARNLLINDKFDLKKAYNALKISDLTEAEKVNFIYGSFDGSGKNENEIQLQNDARMYLIQSINISKQLQESLKNDFENDIIKKHTKNNSSRKKYVSDPVYRWRFYSELDEDCTYDICVDGTVVCKLPNLNNGMVFFEKMLNHTKNGISTNYGDAIYVTTLEDYLNNKHEIIQDKRFSKRAVMEMKDNNQAMKFIHAPGYGNKIKESLNISSENNFDQERIERIDKIIEQIENSRELLR